ncbi:MAG TPA: GIY-YIG nuclease family protein [Chitinophagaceae bacterium]|nr:GIY-YIG nuclease family protein [Chitinophagaceae bacterium]
MIESRLLLRLRWLAMMVGGFHRHCEEIKKTFIYVRNSTIDEAIYICNMGGYVYIMASINNAALYVGVTSNLPVRILQHKQKEFAGFTAKYNCTKLVYYKRFDTIEEAIAGEKRIKGGSRKKKELLINSINPEWRDLYEEII